MTSSFKDEANEFLRKPVKKTIAKLQNTRKGPYPLVISIVNADLNYCRCHRRRRPESHRHHHHRRPHSQKVTRLASPSKECRML